MNTLPEKPFSSPDIATAKRKWSTQTQPLYWSFGEGGFEKPVWRPLTSPVEPNEVRPEVRLEVRPLAVEYCSGNGRWIIERALAEPDSHWIAIEKKLDRAHKICTSAQKFQLHNLTVICSEALFITQNHFAENSLSKAFVNFPDPWPKRRHAKYRLITPSFAEALRRCLKPAASLTFVTDDPQCGYQACALLQAGGLEALTPPPHYLEFKEGYGTSFFEELWRSKGRSIRYYLFQKPSHPQLPTTS